MWYLGLGYWVNECGAKGLEIMERAVHNLQQLLLFVTLHWLRVCRCDFYVTECFLTASYDTVPALDTRTAP